MKTLVASLIGIVVFCSSLHAREWTDNTGRYRREGDLLYMRGKLVVLKLANGKTGTVLIDRLSEQDLTFLEQVEREATNLKPRTAVKTLTYKSGMAANAARAESYSLKNSISNGSGLLKLTGWHHCHQSSNCCPTPCPPNPCPPVPDTGKRIYSSNHATFHLFSTAKPPSAIPVGTGTYWFRDSKGCCHHYLALLKLRALTTNADYVYESVDAAGSPSPTGNVRYWKFTSHHPYTISYSNAGPMGPFVNYEYAYREIPE